MIDTPQGIEDLRTYLKDFDVVALDTETTGLDRNASIIGVSVCCEEDKAYYVILQRWDKEASLLLELECRKAIKGLLGDLVCKSLVMHNSVFDCIMVNINYKIDLMPSLHTDTLILAHLLDENRRVGLKELSKSMFGEDSANEQAEMKASVLANGGKLTKDEYELYKADPQLIAKYGAKDALLTYKLFLALVPDLFDQNLDDFFYKDESMPLLRGPTYQLNLIGIKVDLQALTNLKKTLEVECVEHKSFIYREIAVHINSKYPGTSKKTTFNIGSSNQLSWLLFGVLGLEFGTLTDGGKAVCKSMGLRLPYTPTAKRDFIHACTQDKDSVYAPEAKVNGKTVRAKKIKDPWAYIACDKKTLKKLSPKYKWIEELLEYQRKTKLLSTYIEGIESRVHYGVLYGSFLQHGTSSGRYASRNPNMQNLPRDEKRIKKFLVSRPGKSFVGADFSQLEPRVFAYISQDNTLMDVFNSGTDFYSEIGMEVFDITDSTPYKDGGPNAFGIKYKELRFISKEIGLAAVYGATAHQLAPKTGKSTDETQEIINKYFERFPYVAKMMVQSHEMAKKDGEVKSLFGRPRRLPEAKRFNKLYGNLPHGELPYEVRNVLNLAVNHRIQSTGASICNRAMIKFDSLIKELDLKDCHIVMQVHDEIIVECRDEDAETVKLLLQDAMETAVELPGVPLEAIPNIAKNIADLK